MKINCLIKAAAFAGLVAFAAPATAGVILGEKDDSKLKLEALLFLNSYQQQADTTTAASTLSTKTVGMAVDRAYFTARYYINSDWMMRITLDAANDTSIGGKKQNVFLKAAYVEGKLIDDAVVLRIGQSHTPWIDYEQGLWKHRYASKVLTDTYKLDDSFDLGIGLKGKLANGMAKYFVTVTNGSGYGNAARSNGLDFNGRIGVYPIEGLTLDLQGRSGYRSSKTDIDGVSTAGVKSTMMQAMISYGTNDFRIGGNYVNNKDKASSATVSKSHGGAVSSGFSTAIVGDEVKTDMYALWAWAKIDKVGVFGRYENVTNNKNTVATDEKLNRYMAGVEYFVNKNVTLSLMGDSTELTNRAGVAANSRKDARFGLYTQIKM